MDHWLHASSSPSPVEPLRPPYETQGKDYNAFFFLGVEKEGLKAEENGVLQESE